MINARLIAGRLPGAATFGELLREKRIRGGLSQESLAELAAMSVQAVSALERGARSRPYKDTVERLAQALGLSAQERDEFEIAAQRKSRVRGSNSSENMPEHCGGRCSCGINASLLLFFATARADMNRRLRYRAAFRRRMRIDFA